MVLEPRQAQRRVDLDSRRRTRRAEPPLPPTPTCVFESGAVPVDLGGLRAANPALVTVSISPFGGTGPKAGWPATDLTVLAAGCQLAITGDADRPPVRTARAAGVPARRRRRRRRRPAGAHRAGEQRPRPARRHLRAALDHCRPPRATCWPSRWEARPLSAPAAASETGGLDVQLRWPCKDGFVSVTFLFGASIGPFTRRLMALDPRGGLLRRGDPRQGLDRLRESLYDGREPIAEYERLKAVVEHVLPDQDQGRAARGGAVADPAHRPGRHPRRRRRQHPVRGRATSGTTSTIRSLGDQPVRARRSVSPGARSPRVRLGRAPRLGEHTDEVLASRAPARPSTTPRRRRGSSHGHCRWPGSRCST